MKTIYINNVRGFKNTFISLKDVNFLVGENSTGKTTIIKIINLVKNNRLWTESDLRGVSEMFGDFSDITDEKTFELGVEDSEGSKGKFEYVLIEFKKKDDLPYISKFRRFNNSMNIVAEFRKNSVAHKMDLVDSKYEVYDFQYWVSNETTKIKKFKIEKSASFLKLPLAFMHIFFIQRRGQEMDDMSSNIIPRFVSNVINLAPIRTAPKRTYDGVYVEFDSEGKHTPYLMRKHFNEKNRDGIFKLINTFGKESGLYEYIEINPLGNSNSSPFEITICKNNRKHKITNVGYGVSQILPLLVEMISGNSHSWYCIQQPEIHLHPKAQAAFGDFLFNTSIRDSKKFIIETHSDFTVDRFRLKMSKSKKDKVPSSQALFFEYRDGHNTVTHIEIEPDGKFAENQPESFRDFFIKEQFDLIQV